MGRRTGRSRGPRPKASDREVLLLKGWLIEQAKKAGKPYYDGKGRPPAGHRTVLQDLCRRLKMSRWAVTRALEKAPRSGRKTKTLAELRASEEGPKINGAQLGNEAPISERVGSNPLPHQGALTPSLTKEKYEGRAIAHPLTVASVPATRHPVPGVRGLEAIGLKVVEPPGPKPGPATPVASPTRGGPSLPGEPSPVQLAVREALEEGLHAFIATGGGNPAAEALAGQLLKAIAQPEPPTK